MEKPRQPRHKHRVAMVTEEIAWSHHQPNTGMARMFVIMLMIHIIVIGGIIVYDFMNGEAVPQTEPSYRNTAAAPASSLPAPAVTESILEKEHPIDEYATYEWTTGDSLPLVAQKLGVSEEVLIKLNMLDKGMQIDQHTILRYPRRPVVKAVGVNVASGTEGVAPQVAIAPVTAAPAESVESNKKSDKMIVSVDKAPVEKATFEPNILNRLTPAPVINPVRSVEQSPPKTEVKPLASIEDAPPATNVTKAAPTPAAPKVAEKEVPKAIPYTRPTNTVSQQPAVKDKEMGKEKPVVKKVVNTPPAKVEAKSKAASTSSTRGTAYTVKPGDTLYRIAIKNGVSVSALQKANNITKPESLRDGMKLTIPAK